MKISCKKKSQNHTNAKIIIYLFTTKEIQSFFTKEEKTFSAFRWMKWNSLQDVSLAVIFEYVVYNLPPITVFRKSATLHSGCRLAMAFLQIGAFLTCSTLCSCCTKPNNLTKITGYLHNYMKKSLQKNCVLAFNCYICHVIAAK